MQLTHALNGYKHTGHLAFKLRDELSLPYKLALAFTFTCLSGLSAQDG